MLRIKYDQRHGVILGTKQLLKKCQFSPFMNPRQLPSCQLIKYSDYKWRHILSLSLSLSLSLDLHIPCDKSEKQPSRPSTHYWRYAHITPCVCDFIWRLNFKTCQDTWPFSQHFSSITSGERHYLVMWILSEKLGSLKSSPSPNYFVTDFMQTICSAMSNNSF